MNPALQIQASTIRGVALQSCSAVGLEQLFSQAEASVENSSFSPQVTAKIKLYSVEHILSLWIGWSVYDYCYVGADNLSQ